MKPYRSHVFVCLGKRCAAKGAEPLFEELKALIKDQDIKDVKVSRSGCLKLCKETDTEAELCPAVVVYPQGVWYRNMASEDLKEFVERLKKGETLERLVHFKLG